MFDNVGDLLESVNVIMALSVIRGDNQEGRSFKKDNLISIDGGAELFQVLFESLYIRKEEIDYLGPGFVKSLIPYAGLEAVNFKALGLFGDFHSLLLEAFLSLGLSQKVHFVNQAENLGFLGELAQSIQTTLVILEVTIEVFACDVKDIDQHLYVLEDVFSLGLEVLLHKKVLTTTVPERKN